MLVIQSDFFNESRIQTVVIAIITANLYLADAPGNVFLEHESSGLPRDSVVNVSQLLTPDRSLLTERVATLPSFLMANVDAGLRLVTGL